MTIRLDGVSHSAHYIAIYSLLSMPEFVVIICGCLRTSGAERSPGAFWSAWVDVPSAASFIWLGILFQGEVQQLAERLSPRVKSVVEPETLDRLNRSFSRRNNTCFVGPFGGIGRKYTRSH